MILTQAKHEDKCIGEFNTLCYTAYFVIVYCVTLEYSSNISIHVFVVHLHSRMLTVPRMYTIYNLVYHCYTIKQQFNDHM